MCAHRHSFGASLLALLALGSACGGHSHSAAPAPPHGSTCPEVAAALGARMHGPALAAMTDATAAFGPYYAQVTAAVAASCTADAWTPAVRQCLVDAQAAADLRVCEDAITLDQRGHLKARLAPLLDQQTAEALRNRMCACTTASCAEQLEVEIGRWDTGIERKYRDAGSLPDKLVETMTESVACENRAKGSTVDGEDQAESFDTGVPECDAFLALQDSFFACDKVPQQAKDAMKQSMDQQKQAWAMLKDPNVPMEAKRAAADGCRQGADALRQSAAAMGCSVPEGGSAGVAAPMPAPAPTAPYQSRYPEHSKANWAKQLKGRATTVRACDRFLVIQDRYFACDKVPRQAKDAMKQSMDQQKQAWVMLSDPNVPQEAKAAASDGCAQGTDALIDSARAMGCAIVTDR
jgi:hypothetical protein